MSVNKSWFIVHSHGDAIKWDAELDDWTTLHSKNNTNIIFFVERRMFYL